MPSTLRFLLCALVAALGAACGHRKPGESALNPDSTQKPVRILFLHHSTGENIWDGGVVPFLEAYNRAHGTNYQITERWYPDPPYGNYAYDYWNLWVNPAGPSKGTEPGLHNLETLVATRDVIIFKHCFPASSIQPDTACDPPSVASSVKTLANYRLQYEALKARMRQFPNTKFILWTGAVLTQASTNPEKAQRARDFNTWVKNTWDEKGDNIFLWDFYALETEGALYMKDAYAHKPDDAHPAKAFSRTVAPLLGQRIADVIEGRGDSGSLTGK